MGVEEVQRGKDSTLVVSVGMNQVLGLPWIKFGTPAAPSLIEELSDLSGGQSTANHSWDIDFFTCRACRVGCSGLPVGGRVARDIQLVAE